MMATFICYYITTSSVVLWLMVYLTAATCPGGYTSVGSHCYKYHSSTPMTWTAGKAACRGIGATLPAIKSESERNSFMTFRSESGSTWLMAQESVNANPFEAAWLDDAPDLRPTWTDWAPSSPNGVNGDCLAIDASGKFVDESCSTSHPIYCSVRSCPTGFLRVGRFCYKDLAQSTDYFTSRTQCADENARQPMFHNQENFDDFNTWNPFPTDWTWFGAEDGQDEGNWLVTPNVSKKWLHCKMLPMLLKRAWKPVLVIKMNNKINTTLCNCVKEQLLTSKLEKCDSNPLSFMSEMVNEKREK